jgi:hypothetical protein
MKYVSYAERTGEVKGAKKSLRTLMKAKFGEEGAALVDSLDEGIDFLRLESLITAAGLKNDLDELRPLFHSTNGSGASTR